MLLVGQHMRAAEALAARDDRDLVERIGLGREIGDSGVACLVHGQPVAFLGMDGERAHGAHHHLVARLGKVFGGDEVAVTPRRLDRRLVE